MKVFIITEGGRQIGSGHITRCISLCDAFSEREIKSTFIITGDATIKGLLENKDCKIFDWLKEENKAISMIDGADIVIIDSYLAGLKFYNKVSKLVRSAAYIDDYKRLDYPGGIVINGSVDAEKINYPEKEDITYLLGSRYAFLRKELHDTPQKEINNRIETIMVAFGGDDGAKMTPRVLNFLNEEYPKLKKNIIIGAGFDRANVRDIEKLKGENVSLIYSAGVEQIKQVMLQSDIAVSACGQTLYELAAIGVPTIGICVAENQSRTVGGWKRSGFLEYIGWYNAPDIFNNMKRSITLLDNVNVRKEKSKIGRSLIDGKGPSRVASALLGSRLREAILLKMASLEDTSDIFSLANDDAVRKGSFSPQKIEWGEHVKWLEEKLKNKNCIFFVAVNNRKFCGFVRFDIDPRTNDAVVSIGLEENIRGLGLSPLIITESIDELLKMRSDVTSISAYIKEDNMPSIRSFERAGFRLVKDDVVKGSRAKVFIKEVDYGVVRNR